MRLKIWFNVLKYYMLSLNCCKKAHILSINETCIMAKEYRKSIIRLGDGEFNLLNNRDIHYQKFSEDLKNILKIIIDEYISNPDNANYLLCMPGEFFNCNGLKLLKRRVYISSWAFSRYFFKKNYDKDIIYGNSFLFASGNKKIYEQIWLENKIDKVVFVHNKIEYAKEFEEEYGIKTEYVLVPPKNAYEVKEDILKNIKTLINNKEKILVLISAGPCAKYLVYKLALEKVWAIDTGHCWDNPLNLRK